MRAAHVWQLATLLLLVAGYVGLYRWLPPRLPVEPDSALCGWFGQSAMAAYGYAAEALVLLYVLRYTIAAKARTAADALVWYALLLGALLPCIWFLVVLDWDNPNMAPAGNWVGAPIMLLFVPTLVFCWDVASGRRWTANIHLILAMIEVTILIPCWAIVWLICEFLILGWFG